MQQALIKGATALAQSVNIIIKQWNVDIKFLEEQNFEKVIEHTTKAFQALGIGNFELCCRRKEAMSREYSHMCAALVPYTNRSNCE